MGQLPPAIPSIYAIISLLTLVVYARDKSKAKSGAWRTPEATLYLLDALGGWPGGLIAQQSFRHKNRKLSFQIVFWFCASMHLGFWAWAFVTLPAVTDLAAFMQTVLKSSTLLELQGVLK